MNDADTYSEFVSRILGEKYGLDCAFYVSKLWPFDLVLNIFDVLEDTFVIEFHEGWMKSVASRVFTRCFLEIDLVT